MDAFLPFRFTRGSVMNMLARLAVVAALCCSFASLAGAQDRDVLLRFLPPENAPVTGYSVYATDVATDLEELFEVGYLAPGSDGVARTSVVLDAARSYRVAMTASNAAGESARSNEIHVAAEAPLCDPALCDDANPCSADSCDAGGCFSTPLPEGTLCDDGFVDTVDDQCVQGACEGVLLACRGDLDCDDGNVCNGLEECDGGTVCLEGIPLDCGEPTACTIPRCDGVAGCLTELRPDGVACDDGSADTVDDQCVQGVCEGTPATSEPPLVVEGIDPAVVFPGRQTLRVYGQGFVPGSSLSFINGAGPAPRVTSLRLVDARTLEARVDVSRKGSRRARVFDALVTTPDGSQALLRGALRIER